VLSADGRGLTLRSPTPLPLQALISFELLLGARPLGALARVVDSRPEAPAGTTLVSLEFVALAQMDRDTLVDFLQAVGASALGIRAARGD